MVLFLPPLQPLVLLLPVLLLLLLPRSHMLT
jgi:hypothetical protein